MNFVQRNASNLHELTEASTDCKPKVSRRGLVLQRRKILGGGGGSITNLINYNQYKYFLEIFITYK